MGGVAKDMDSEWKKKNGEEAFWKVLSESEDRTQEKKEGCVLYAALDESRADREINCQERPVNPLRQRGSTQAFGL